MEYDEPQSPVQLMPSLPVYESGQHMAKSINLHDLIKIHRNRQKYQIVDRFFNNSYILVENKLLPIEAYYQYQSFKCYLDDLSLAYFKDIELYQNVRLAFVLRRLNFTLNGQIYNFRLFLENNKFYDEMMNLFSDEYLNDLMNESNKKSVLDLRNNIMLCFVIDILHTYNFPPDHIEQTIHKINNIYHKIRDKMSDSIRQVSQQSAILADSHDCFLDNLSSQSYSQCPSTQSLQEGTYNFWFDDLIYQQQMDLKIIQLQLQIAYLSSQSEMLLQELSKLSYLYIIEINKEYVQKLKELRQLNLQNRQIVKNIQKNIRTELKTGVKCICIQDSSDYQECFGDLIKGNTIFDQKGFKLQRIVDIQFMEDQLMKMISKLKLRMIADSIEKVYDIKKQDEGEGKVLYSVSFEYGLGKDEAVFDETDFLKLNQFRQQSLLTSYLTPMKSTYSYISHNIYSFLNLMSKDMCQGKESKNNQQIIKNIHNKLSKSNILVNSQLKAIYQNNFKLCHNCKILCHQAFTKQCKKRVKQPVQEEQDCSDDSLYIQKNCRRALSAYLQQCQRYYCFYCIKNQFNGKIFNDKGWCPACLNSCHCNNCLRQKILKKYVELFIFIGGDKNKIKSEKDIITEMSNKVIKNSKESSVISSLEGTQIEERVYQPLIKKQILKGFSPDQVSRTLKHQQMILELIVQRESLKLKNLGVQRLLFREKIGFLNNSFNYEGLDLENKAQLAQIQQQKKRQQEEQFQRRKRIREHINEERQKDMPKRKKRKLNRDSSKYCDYFYKFNEDDSDFESQSFHLKQKKGREKKYQPQFYY